MDEVIFLVKDVHAPHELFQIVETIHLCDFSATEAGFLYQFF